jgi:ABC-type antimicrobial peptide transport system permease subunit
LVYLRYAKKAISKIRPVLLVLSAAVLFVLLIGCANIANLLMARAAARSKEISIRAALGATRGRLVRQLLTESVLLAVIGGALGVILAAWGIPLLLSVSPAEIGGFLQVGLNREVLGFTLLASIATGLMFGIAPALYASQSNPNESLSKRAWKHV